MNLLGLLLFGIIFSFVLFGYVKPDVVFPHATYVYLKDGRIPMSKRATYFPFLLSAVGVFLVLSGFQYINTAEFTRSGFDGTWSNDMSRYWFGFQDAGSLPFRLFLLSQGQEPLYLVFIYVMRKLTVHFSFVLLVAYAFFAVSVIQFLKDFVLFRSGVQRQSFLAAVLSFFVIFYIFILVSFCLFRMGLAVAISMHTCRFLLKGKWKGAYFASLVACGFHFSAMILFPVCIMYRIYRSGKLKFSFFLFLFFAVFVLGLVFAKVVPQIMKLFSSRYLAYGNEEGVTVKMHFANILFVLMVLYRRKDFFRTKQDEVCFIILLSNFFVFDLQLIISIFYRMLMFSYPCSMILIPRLFQIYKIRRNDMIVPLLARLFLAIYLLYSLYIFCFYNWISYGLSSSYKLFYFY